jgi:hypothetical protein
MKRIGRHVVPNPKGGWAVRKSGAIRATRVFETEQEAEQFGRELARKEHGELYVHRRDGTIRKRDTYGDDSFSPKG